MCTYQSLSLLRDKQYVTCVISGCMRVMIMHKIKFGEGLIPLKHLNAIINI